MTPRRQGYGSLRTSNCKKLATTNKHTMQQTVMTPLTMIQQMEEPQLQESWQSTSLSSQLLQTVPTCTDDWCSLSLLQTHNHDMTVPGKLHTHENHIRPSPVLSVDFCDRSTKSATQIVTITETQGSLPCVSAIFRNLSQSHHLKRLMFPIIYRKLSIQLHMIHAMIVSIALPITQESEIYILERLVVETALLTDQAKPMQKRLLVLFEKFDVTVKCYVMSMLWPGACLHMPALVQLIFRSMGSW